MTRMLRVTCSKQLCLCLPHGWRHGIAVAVKRTRIYADIITFWMMKNMVRLWDELKIFGAYKITKDTLYSFPMRIAWVVQET